KILELREVNAALPVLRLAEPGFKERLAQVSALRMTALPFREPGAAVTALRGSFPFNNDSVWWKGVSAAMPGSRMSGSGNYQFNSGDLTVDAHGDPVSTADLRW